jgi:hypothetical protein
MSKQSTNYTSSIGSLILRFNMTRAAHQVQEVGGSTAHTNTIGSFALIVNIETATPPERKPGVLPVEAAEGAATLIISAKTPKS